MEIIYVVDGVASRYSRDTSNAYVEFDGRMVFKKDHPNVFRALTSMPCERFDYRMIPMSGVELTKIENV